MKKVNFWKGLTMAAAVMVSVFATSCSEENMNIEGIDIPTQNLPNAKASVSITVVDLEEGEIVGNVTSIDATSAIGSTITVECPANAGYTTAKPVTVAIPSLEKGQAIVIPVTFYVVSLDSALEELLQDVDFVFEEVEEIIGAPIELSGEGWEDNIVINTDEFDFLEVEATCDVIIGWDYEGEISSRAAETTVIDLIKNLEPVITTLHGTWQLAPMTSLFVEAKQIVTSGTVSVITEDGEIIAEFIGSEYSYIWNEDIEDITHDEPSHDEPSHDDHGHGHGSGNAGGGIGGDNAGE